jgi:outer membrane protein assembly factor BamB
MTRLIRSRRAVASCLAAITVGGLLAVAAATGVGSGVATPPRAHRAVAAAQVRAGGQDRTLTSGQHSLKAATSFSDWPMFMDGPAHPGTSAETVISTATAASLKQGWSATLGTNSVVSPAVATSSTLGKAVLYAAANGTIDAYPATTGGSPIWTFKLGTGGGNFQASPAVFNGVVYAASDVGTVYALNAATGAQQCSYSTGGQQLQGSPIVVSDTDGSGPVLYVGTDPTSGQGAEYAVYGAGNTHGSCALEWKYTDTAYNNFGTWAPPGYGTDANGNPIVVFGSRDSDDSVYALNAKTGALDWRYQTATTQFLDVGAAPTISAPGNNGFASGVVYITGKDKVVYALNLTTGAKIWSYKLVKTSTGAALSTAALDGDTLYVGSNDGVYAINATTGALVYHVLAGPTFYASPAITGPAGQQVLVIGDNAGRIYVLNLATGATLWTKRPNTVGFWASVAVSQGRIYSVSTAGRLLVYKPA